MADIAAQLDVLEEQPAVIVLSVGGNDAVDHIGVLDQQGTSSAEVLAQLLQISNDFSSQYEKVARAVASRAERTILCTIYDVQLEPAPYAELVRIPLAVINDRIIQVAARLGLDVIDLRTVCTDPGDFVMQIEPSSQGAEKIANMIARVVAGARDLAPGRVFAA